MLDEVLDELDEDDRRAIERQIGMWESSSNRHLAVHLRKEQQLIKTTFVQFARTLLDCLNSSVDTVDAYSSACHQYSRQGQKMKENVPAFVGRAVELSKYAQWVSEASESSNVPISTGEAEQVIVDSTVSREDDHEDHDYLRAAIVGRHLVWGTFNDEDRAAVPFDHLPDKKWSTIRCAYGLGHLPDNEIAILLTYTPSVGSGHLDLHCPTIADAAGNPFFEPVSQPGSEYGWTLPLDTTLSGISRQPEIVHIEITGDSLQFPISTCQ